MKVAVFTSTRAEYGLLYYVLRCLDADPDITLSIVASGAHLSPEFGSTVDVIRRDGFQVQETLEVLLSSDTSVGVCKSMGLVNIGLADVLTRISPDIMVLVGDRYEALAAASAALILRIPIFHCHGGEVTEGAYDDPIRHAISKLSSFHGVSAEQHARRLKQMGEDPSRIFNVGALGLEYLRKMQVLSERELEKTLDLDLRAVYCVMTFHPVTHGTEDAVQAQIDILEALMAVPDLKVIATYPNADDGGRKLISIIHSFQVRFPERIRAFKSLGQRNYLSLLSYAAFVIGNSSSGIIEAPSVPVWTINVGDRQRGRLASETVVNVACDKGSILNSIEKVLAWPNKPDCLKFPNPYGSGESSSIIVDVIKGIDLTGVKKFVDIN